MRVDASGPSVEDLRTYLLLADIAGVAEVARRLGVDVSVVSRRLRPFRVKFGLLRKQGGSLVLTDRGRETLPTVRALLNEYDQLTGMLNRRTPAGQVLTLAVGSFGAVWLVPAVVAQFSHLHPDTEVKAHLCRGRERIRGVADGRFDLAVVSHSLEQIRALLGDLPVGVERLAARPFAVVARRGTAAGDALAAVAAEGVVTVRELAGATLVGLDEAAGVRTQLERQGAEVGVALRFGPSGGGWLAAKEYARHGLGVAIVPLALVSDEDLKDLVARILSQPLWPGDHLLYRTSDVARTGALKQVVIETVADHARRQQQRIGQLMGRQDG